MKATEAMDMNARSSHKSATKKLDHLRIHKAANGGHLVEHHFESAQGYHEPDQHVFSKGEGGKMIEHISKHLGIKSEKAEGDEKGDGAVETAAD